MDSNKKLVGYFKGDAFCIDENGVPYLVSTLEERINKRTSEIDHELRHVVRLYQQYIQKQINTKSLLGKKVVQLSDWEKKRVQKRIAQNKLILRGMATYISQLNAEKVIIQKNHPKNMKKKTEDNQ
jgi:hypothetical protein